MQLYLPSTQRSSARNLADALRNLLAASTSDPLLRFPIAIAIVLSAFEVEALSRLRISFLDTSRAFVRDQGHLGEYHSAASNRTPAYSTLEVGLLLAETYPQDAFRVILEPVALEVFRADPTCDQANDTLGKAFRRIDGKLEQESYVMTRIEYAIVMNIGQEFLKKDKYRKAIERYWSQASALPGF